MKLIDVEKLCRDYYNGLLPKEVIFRYLWHKYGVEAIPTVKILEYARLRNNVDIEKMVDEWEKDNERFI